jgi:hypothetical protein
MLENKYHERLALKNRKGHVALQIYNSVLVSGKKLPTSRGKKQQQQQFSYDSTRQL